MTSEAANGAPAAPAKVPRENAGERWKRALVRQYYLFQFAFSMLFWTPVFFAFQKSIGLSDAEIFRIQSWYYLLFCVLEIPTGYFADRIGYLNSIRLGAATLVASHLVAIGSPTYGGQWTHWMLLALARSFISGATSAYLYEFLRQQDLVGMYKGIEGKARAYTLYGRVLCFAAVGFLMRWHALTPYYLTLATAVASLGLAFALPSIVPSATTAIENRRVRLAEAWGIAMRSPWLLFLMVQGIATFVMGRIITVNLFQPLLGGSGFDVRWFGLIMGGVTLCEAVGSMNPDWVRRGLFGRGLGDLQAVYVLTALMGATMVGMWACGSGVGGASGGTFGGYGVVAMLALFSVVTGFAFPIQKQLMNDAIPEPRYRATLLSVESILDRAVCAGVAWLLEQASAGGGPDAAGAAAGSGATSAASGLDVFSFAAAAGLASIVAMILLYGWQRLGFGASPKDASASIG